MILNTSTIVPLKISYSLQRKCSAVLRCYLLSSFTTQIFMTTLYCITEEFQSVAFLRLHT